MRHIIAELKIERDLLSKKIIRGAAALADERVTHMMGDVQHKLLIEQVNAMSTYLSVLDSRIEDLESNLKEEVGGVYISLGEDIVGRFNPSGNPFVEEIKLHSIALINYIDKVGLDARRKSIAITEIEKGTMFAVKSLF